MKITVVGYITGRPAPHLEWVLEGLTRQSAPRRHDSIQVIAIDALDRSVDQTSRASIFAARDRRKVHALSVTRPKPSIWQGPHRDDVVRLVGGFERAKYRPRARRARLRGVSRRRMPTSAMVGSEAVRGGYRQRASVIAGTYDKIESWPASRPTRAERPSPPGCAELRRRLAVRLHVCDATAMGTRGQWLRGRPRRHGDGGLHVRPLSREQRTADRFFRSKLARRAGPRRG